MVRMINSRARQLIERLANGRTHLVFALAEANCPADYKGENGILLGPSESEQ